MPAPRILQGPFRNVDPHTSSLAVYFRGPASELFNMLNPESPGAISVLARTCIYLCTLSELYLRVCANVCVCFFIRTWPNLYKYVIRETTTYAHLYVRVIYYEDEAGTRTFRLLVLCYMRAIGHVLNRATLRQLADRQLRIRTEIVAYFQRIIHMTNCLRAKEDFQTGIVADI